jgi:ribosomal protein S18 acetylase RimI-like enzyme
MAALWDRPVVGTPVPRVVELRHIRPDDLEPLLREEVDVWRQALEWDLEPSAELVRRFVRMQSLAGHALIAGTQVLGYAYYVTEERKGLIGDVYVRRQSAGIGVENLLIDAALGALRHSPHIRRVESQLMMLTQAPGRRFPLPGQVRIHEREFMMIDLDAARYLHPAPVAAVAFEPWTESRQEEAARLIAEAYAGHVDAEINDQYRSPAGARRFLMNIVQYPGCGTFYGPGSVLAIDAGSGRLAGISLASLVAADTGHITQICVHPSARGRGAGYEMLRLSLLALARYGCRRASLTVTSANENAIQLYEDVGFAKRRRFVASVWEW